jgi:hypothetical protein
MASISKNQLVIDGNLVDSATVATALQDAAERPEISELTLRNVSIDNVVSKAMDRLLLLQSTSTSNSSKRDRIWSKLELSHCTGDLAAVLRSAATCDRIEQIYFAGTVPVAHNPRYCLDLPSLEAIKRALQTCTKLNLMCLKGTRLATEGMRLLSDGIASSKHLKTLRMSEIAMEATDMHLLAAGLSKNKHLTMLLFSSCRLSGTLLQNSNSNNNDDDDEDDNPSSYFCLVLEAIRSHPTLEILSTNGVELTTRGSIALANLMSSPTTKLWHLALKNNVATPDMKLVVTPIIDALRENRTLTHLQISGNNVDDDDMERIAQIISSDNSTLQGLSLPANNIHDAGLRSFSTRLVNMKGLRFLDLMRNHFSETAKNKIIEELKENFEMERLDLDGNFSSKKSFYLALNKGGRRLKRATRVPIGVWPIVFERASKLVFGRNLPNGNLDVLFCLVRGSDIFEYSNKKRQLPSTEEDSNDRKPPPSTHGGPPPIKKRRLDHQI